MRESRPGKGVDLQYIVQELHEFEGAGPNLFHLLCLLDDIEMTAHVMDATSRGCDHVVEAGEIAHE